MLANTIRIVLAACFIIWVGSAQSADIIDLLEWSITGEKPELRAEGKQPDGSSGQRNCICDGPSCICCADFKLTFIDLGGPGCVRMKYISQEEGFAVNISYGNSLLHSQIVKGPNPEPSCMNVLSRVAQLCARLTDLAPTTDGLRGCLQLEPTLLGDPQVEFPLGCFKSGPDGMSMEMFTNNITALENNTPGQPPTGIKPEDIIQVVNESAEEGIAFISNLLGLALGNSTEEVEDSVNENSSTIVPTDVSTAAPVPETKQARSGKYLSLRPNPNLI